MTEMELMERIVKVEGCTVSNTRRIEDLEQRQGALEELTASVKVLAVRQENTEKSINEVKDGNAIIQATVQQILLQPGKKWEKVAEYVMLAIIGIIIAAIAVKIGLK